ncbi:hypothetical protein [Mesobacillus foraminis]|uniref:Lipoprotein n=1 Tax=Mesobacillus foraminis TaxID=279826 RepID=A0A4R2BKS7_9BACI|nr:hypothetical protein [Mesobacillus foraminis]TCN27253.1 hypothetical protein EV146_102200 [Mesobacillus foraminis]
MKLRPFLPISAAMMFALTACNADEEKIKIQEDVTNPSREEVRYHTQNEAKEAELLNNEVGLGDIREHFDRAYGKNNGDEEIAKYQGNFMLVTYEMHRAVNIQYQFGSYPKGEMSDEEIRKYIQERIPKDSIEMRKYTDKQNSDQELFEYKSESLGKALSRQSFRGDEPGTFTVVLSKNETGDVTAILSLGKGNKG